VALVAVLPLLDAALGRRTSRGGLALCGAVAAVAAGSIAVGLVGHGFVGGEAPRELGARSLVEALWAAWLQARHVVWPQPLLARYFPPEGAALAGGAVAGGLVLTALGVAAAMCWRRGRREVGFAIAAAVLAYAPVSGIVPLSRGAADSYLYLPLALAVAAGARGIDRLASGRRAAVVGAVAAAAIGLGAVSARQTRVWEGARALWLPVARAYPDEPRALMRLGDAHVFEGDAGAALAQYEEVRGRFPRFGTSLPAHARVLEALGREDRAEALLAEAVQLDRDRDLLEAYGWFLATHEVAPSGGEEARRALLVVGRALAERGKRVSTVRRAAALLRGFGEVGLAGALERRAEELVRRAARGGAPPG
jgi:tetratricopeptide (TPR) repeat protein